MKLFRVLLVFIFMFAALVATTAQAAGGEKVGFIRLISTVDSKLSFQAQVRHAYDRIRPQLFALQKQGRILAFEPELKAGIVKVVYAASSGPTMTALSQYQTFDSIQAAIVRAPNAAGPTAPEGSPEAISPTFFIELYDSCFSASNLGADSHVVGSLRDKTGRLVASYESDADSNGQIFLDCFPWSGVYSDVMPGYTLTFKAYDSTPLLLGTFTVVVPSLKFTSINKTAAVVRGTGPVGKTFYSYWTHENWDAGNTLSTNVKSGVIPADGAWFKDMSTGSIYGGDYLEVETLISNLNSNFWFHTSMTAPSIYCEIGGNYCELFGFPFQPAALSIVHAGTTYSFSGKFDSAGSFAVLLENAGDPIFLKAGDKVSGTNVPAYTLPSLTGTINFSADIVFGKVPANRYFNVWAYTLCSCSSYLVYSSSNGTGNYSSDFFSQVDLLKTGATNIAVYYVDPVTGNMTGFYRSFGP